MKPPYVIQFARAAEMCLSDIESLKITTLGAEAAAHFVDALLDDIVEHLENDPLRYRQNIQLAELGFDAREFLEPNGYRTLYGVKEQVIDVWLVLHTRQDVEKALWRYMMFQ